MRLVFQGLRILAMAFFILSFFSGATEAQPNRDRARDRNEPPALYGQGLDPMSYFLYGQAFFGRPEIYFEDQSNNVVYFFVSEESREAFTKKKSGSGGIDRDKLPQYGGYDAYSMAFGQVYPAAVNIFTIYKDKLYLFYSIAVKRAWEEDPEHFIELADDVYKEKFQKNKDGIPTR